MTIKGLVLFVLAALLSANAPAETKVNAVFAPGQEIRDITGVRYKCRLLENDSPHIIILFGFHRTCGPSNATYMLESNLYANGLRYRDAVITTNANIQGVYVPAQASLRLAVSEYFNPIHCWTRTFSPVLFPRQTYLIDAITNLWKTDMVSQTNLNDTEFAVEVSRGGVPQDFSGWQSAEPRDTKTVFRGWRILVTFGGTTHTNLCAIPEANGLYLTPHEFLEFESEFLWRTARFRAQMWDLELKRESEAVWRPVNSWKVTRQDDSPTNYGARVASRGDKRVIEISNIGQPDYLSLGTLFDLSRPPEPRNRPASR